MASCPCSRRSWLTAQRHLRLQTVGSVVDVMAKDAKQQEARRRRRALAQRIPLEQVSPAILTASRDVAYTLEQLGLQPQAEEVLKAVLERAEHLEEQASGITVIDE